MKYLIYNKFYLVLSVHAVFFVSNQLFLLLLGCRPLFRSLDWEHQFLRINVTAASTITITINTVNNFSW